MLDKIPTAQQLCRRFNDLQNTELTPGKRLETILQLDLFKFPLEEGDCFSIQELNSNHWKIDLKISHGNQLFTIGSVYLNHFSDPSKASMTFSNDVVEEMVLQKKSFADTKSAWNFSTTSDEEAHEFIKQYRKAKIAVEPYLTDDLKYFPDKEKEYLMQEQRTLQDFFSKVMNIPHHHTLGYLSILEGEPAGELSFMLIWPVIIGLAVMGLGIYGISSGAVGDKLFASIMYLALGAVAAIPSTLGLIALNRAPVAKREIKTLLDKAEKLSPEATKLLTPDASPKTELSQGSKPEQTTSEYYYGAVISQKDQKSTKIQWPVHYPDPTTQKTATMQSPMSS